MEVFEKTYFVIFDKNQTTLSMKGIIITCKKTPSQVIFTNFDHFFIKNVDLIVLVILRLHFCKLLQIREESTKVSILFWMVLLFYVVNCLDCAQSFMKVVKMGRFK